MIGQVIISFIEGFDIGFDLIGVLARSHQVQQHTES
jgi:hypothetical protein